MSRSDGDRPKLSYSERDKLLRERKRGYTAPRGREAEARAKASTDKALKEASDLFAAGKGGPDGARLAEAVHSARGGVGFEAACQEYLDGVGPPTEARLASAFLDAESIPLLRAGLESLLEGKAAGLAIDRGLRSRLRMLAEHSDDDVAYVAEQLLED